MKRYIHKQSGSWFTPQKLQILVLTEHSMVSHLEMEKMLDSQDQVYQHRPVQHSFLKLAAYRHQINNSDGNW